MIFFREVQAPLLNGAILDEELESIKQAFRIAARSIRTTDYSLKLEDIITIHISTNRNLYTLNIPPDK